MLLLCACVSKDDALLIDHSTAVYQLQGHPSQAVTVHEKEELQKSQFRCHTTPIGVQAAWPSASAHGSWQRWASKSFTLLM